MSKELKITNKTNKKIKETKIEHSPCIRILSLSLFNQPFSAYNIKIRLREQEN